MGSPRNCAPTGMAPEVRPRLWGRGRAVRISSVDLSGLKWGLCFESLRPVMARGLF